MCVCVERGEGDSEAGGCDVVLPTTYQERQVILEMR